MFHLFRHALKFGWAWRNSVDNPTCLTLSTTHPSKSDRFFLGGLGAAHSPYFNHALLSASTLTPFLTWPADRFFLGGLGAGTLRGFAQKGAGPSEPRRPSAEVRIGVPLLWNASSAALLL